MPRDPASLPVIAVNAVSKPSSDARRSRAESVVHHRAGPPMRRRTVATIIRTARRHRHRRMPDLMEHRIDAPPSIGGRSTRSGRCRRPDAAREVAHEMDVAGGSAMPINLARSAVSTARVATVLRLGLVANLPAGRFLVLHTPGRHSDQPRRTPLSYTKDGDDYIVIASDGGATRHRDWCLNLQADPHAEVERNGRKRPVWRSPSPVPSVTGCGARRWPRTPATPATRCAPVVRSLSCACVRCCRLPDHRASSAVTGAPRVGANAPVRRPLEMR